MNLYLIVLIAIIVWGSFIVREVTDYADVWNRDQMQMIRAAACLGVILHHLSQLVTGYGEINKGPITILSSMGILFTAIFFFSSGYGLIYSIRNKPSYLHHFLSHRLSIILVPFLVSNIIYVLVRIYYTHIPMSFGDIFRCVSGIVLLNGNGWYFVEVAILYIAFYFIFRLIRNDDIAIAFMSIATIYVIYLGFKNGHDDAFSLGSHWFKGEWWYNSTVVFIMGMLVGRFKNSVVAFANRNYKWKLVISTVLFVISFAIEEYVRKVYGYYRESIAIDGINCKLVTFVAQSILCLIFTWLILLINLKVRIGNRVLKYISVISIEIFLIQNLFIHNIFDYKKVSDFMCFTIAIGCSIAGASLMHFLIKWIGKIASIFTVKKETRIDRSAQKVRVSDVIPKKVAIRIGVIGIASIVIICTGILTYTKLIRARMDYKDEFAKLCNANESDVVYFGRFDESVEHPGKERVEWIVLKKDGNRLMLLSKKGIDGSVYNSRHCDVSWEDSDIYKLLNDDIYGEMFSGYEQAVIIGNPDGDEKISLLSVDDAQKLFSTDESRQIELTEYAINKGTYVNNRSKVDFWDEKGYRSSWWWLKGEGSSKTAPIVTVNGEISIDTKYVNKPNGAVRPVIWVDISE